MMIQIRQTSLAKPFLKWAGGKAQLLPQYLAYLPDHFNHYHEPFLGGGAVFFHLQSNTASLADINPDLINLYRSIRDQVHDLIPLLEAHQQAHSLEYYYAVREQVDLNPLDRAARFLYLNKTCFNGLYRENRKGEFNVPLGSYQNPTICDPILLRAAAEALATAQIECHSFERVLDNAQPGDFVYFDPPYHPISSTSNFTSYCRHPFGVPEQIRLSEVFAQLSKGGVKVMLSNSDCDFVRDLYRDYNIHEIEARRPINCNAQARGPISELLITSYDPRGP